MEKTPGGPAGAPAAPGGPPPEAIRAVPVRHYGRWVGAAVVLALLGLLVWAFANAEISWEVVGDHLTYDTILEGAGKTLWITLLSMVIGVVLGLTLAVMRLSRNPVLAGTAWGYIWFFRGTPVLVQLFLWYNLALVFDTLDVGFYRDEMNDVMTPFLAALLGLGLNEAAYMAEIARAGILSVDEGQTEAAHALGMSGAKTMRRIVLPQAMRVIVPPTGNEFINMLKTSSLVYVINYTELFRAQDIISSRNLAVMELLMVATAWYLVLTTVFSIGQYYLERYYARGSQRALPPTPWQRVRAQLTSVRAGGRVPAVGEVRKERSR
ncbi:amino acid ABC transporter permease [Streptomyces sp. DSM 44917]|uniref:Amino acid ABC transporter permease n=1 Tax=Streptomyces boetiae TaxID=3075541 RepID=A0ABU2L9P9_9ACTN|nr:amino acid ABC transporter permease [Streptomyces sp. DSM 44917]MDT0308296.1 amino acid ABC transporter permease [Streptomyces sp. DSM 44917]